MTNANEHSVYPPTDIDPSEDLAYCVFGSSDLKWQDGKPYEVKLGAYTVEFTHDEWQISVDRITHMDVEDAVDKGQERAKNRGSDRTFYGWAITTASETRKEGRMVRSSPLPDESNDFHADIILPPDACRVQRKEHLSELARLSRWESNPRIYP